MTRMHSTIQTPVCPAECHDSDMRKSAKIWMTVRRALSELAIVGVGGTGSYILDQVAKTWVDRIILIDGDVFQNYNAFRAPGAAAHQVLKAKRKKAEYFA